MQELVDEYEKSLKIITDKIKSLKVCLKKEKNPKKIYFLRHDVSAYTSIKNDLLFALRKMKEYQNK